MSHESSQNRRQGEDRRRVPTSLWDALRGSGRRGAIRRAGDRYADHFVDRFPATTLVWVLALLLLSLADGLLTLELLNVSCREVNPVLRRLLDNGPQAFIVGKYVLIAAGLPLLVAISLHRRYRHLIPAFVVLHVVLISYQLILWYQLT